MQSNEEIGRRGQEIYENQLRALLETEENIGKIVSIDIDSGDYEIADDLVIAGRRLQQRHPEARMYGKRIGYNAVYTVASSLQRQTAKRGWRAIVGAFSEDPLYEEAMRLGREWREKQYDAH